MNSKEMLNDIEYIERSFKRIGKKFPELGNMLDTFEKYAKGRASIRVSLKNEISTDLEFNTSDFLNGIPVLNSLEIEKMHEEFKLVLERIMPLIASTFPPLNGKISFFEKSVNDGKIEIKDCFDTALDGNNEKLESVSDSCGVSPDVVNFVLNQSLKVLLECKNMNLNVFIDQSSWSRGYCPVCGSFPDISFLKTSNTEPEKSEFLKAHGAQNWLHCSLCGFEWRVKRGFCPYCENEEKKAKNYFLVNRGEKERIYTCKKCKRYLVSIDERDNIEPNHPEALLVGAVPLFMVAGDRGFIPITDFPLNNAGS